MNKRPDLKNGETSIIAKFNSVNGANFWFKKRGKIEEILPDFLIQAKAAGHQLNGFDYTFNEIKQHLNKKKKELNKSFETVFK